MKISIGTNYFRENSRQTIARLTHSIIQQKHECVTMYNVQFADEKESSNPDATIINLNLLTRSSKNILPKYSKKLPFVKDVFNVLASTDCDVFVYVNSDILITDNLINYIKNNPSVTTTCQRLDIDPITTLSEPIVGRRFEIAGFDAFIFNKNWYVAHQFLFEDFLLGKVYFDHAFALIIKLFGGEHPILNSFPPHIAHIMHGRESHAEDEGNLYNKFVYKNSFAKNLFYIWDNFVHKFLIQRPPTGCFLNMLDNEKNTEKDYFSKMVKKEYAEILKIKTQFNLI